MRCSHIFSLFLVIRGARYQPLSYMDTGLSILFYIGFLSLVGYYSNLYVNNSLDQSYTVPKAIDDTRFFVINGNLTHKKSVDD